MPRPGSRPSPAKCSDESSRRSCPGADWRAGRPLRRGGAAPTRRGVGDAIPRASDRRTGRCRRAARALVARPAEGPVPALPYRPVPRAAFQGTLAPDLAGVGAGLSEGQIRLRVVDMKRLESGHIMPSYYRIDGLTTGSAGWRGKPMLTRGEIEDVVAFLATLEGVSDGRSAPKSRSLMPARRRQVLAAGTCRPRRDQPAAAGARPAEHRARRSATFTGGAEVLDGPRRARHAAAGRERQCRRLTVTVESPMTRGRSCAPHRACSTRRTRRRTSPSSISAPRSGAREVSTRIRLAASQSDRGRRRDERRQLLVEQGRASSSRWPPASRTCL